MKRTRIFCLIVIAAALACLAALADGGPLSAYLTISANRFDGPAEITVTVSVTNNGSQTLPLPVILDPDREPVADFGDPILGPGMTHVWIGTWTVTQEQIEAGEIIWYVRYVYTPDGGETQTVTLGLKRHIYGAAGSAPTPAPTSTPAVWRDPLLVLSNEGGGEWRLSLPWEPEILTAELVHEPVEGGPVPGEECYELIVTPQEPGFETLILALWQDGRVVRWLDLEIMVDDDLVASIGLMELHPGADWPYGEPEKGAAGSVTPSPELVAAYEAAKAAFGELPGCVITTVEEYERILPIYEVLAQETAANAHLNPRICEVTGLDDDERPSSFTINAGSAEGVEPLQPVTFMGGLVGWVEEVREHESTVRTILAPGSEIPAVVYGGTHPETTVRTETGGDGAALLVTGVLPEDCGVEAGQRLVTFNGPSVNGIPIGTVTGSERDPQGGGLRFTLELEADLSHLMYVIVLRYHPWENPSPTPAPTVNASDGADGWATFIVITPTPEAGE